jgi:hypothetical protein
MDVLEKFLHSIAYKFPKGYPDMNNPKDVELLNELLNEAVDSKTVLNEQQTEYDDRIKEALGVEQIPICQTPLELGKDFNLSGNDAEIWKKLFGVKPIAARTGKQTAGSGNGEVSTYWAFQYNKNRKFQVEDRRGADNPDLVINNLGVEIKDYGSKMITLGKFFGDKKSYGLLSNLFGFKSLLEAVKEGKFPEASASNPGTFKSSELVDASRLMLNFYKEAQLKEFAQKYQFEIVLNLFNRVEAILNELGLSGSASPEDVASGILKVMIKTKLSKKPMLGQDRGYVLNVNVNGLGDFVEVSNEKIDALNTEDLLNNIAVAASEMKMNFDALFKD